MFAEIYPRDHARYLSLPVLGPHLEPFVVWLREQGYPRHLIRLRVHAAKALDARLRRDRVRRIGELTEEELLAYAPTDSQKDMYRSALVRSLVAYLRARGTLAPSASTATAELIGLYATHLVTSRGLSPSTVRLHTATVRELLAHVGPQRLEAKLRCLKARTIEEFLQVVGKRLGRESLQHSVAHLRSFLRFLAAHSLAPVGLDDMVDTPRVYRGERLPRALPWEVVRGFLHAIDRSTPMGRRDYAMFLLVVTYGLRSCEVVSLTFDDLAWREGQLRVRRSKVRSPLNLPLTTEVGAAILAYLRNGRPPLPRREVFLRVRGPEGALKPTALTEAFQGWVRRAGLPIPFQGPHCLRHSLAVHLLRRGTSLKTIGDLLGHRSTESTCVYLRLHLEDLRDVPLSLPSAQREITP